MRSSMFVAPASASYVLDTYGTEFDTSLAIYTGASLATLVDETSDCNESSIAFTATMGTTYYVQVGGDDGDSGNLHVHLNLD